MANTWGGHSGVAKPGVANAKTAATDSAVVGPERSWPGMMTAFRDRAIPSSRVTWLDAASLALPDAYR